MKQIYRASDGTIFEEELKCLEHEFKLKAGLANLQKQVDDANDFIRDKYGVEFNNIQVRARIGWDGDPNSTDENYVEWQNVDFDVYKDGQQIGEHFGRAWGFKEGGFTTDSIIEEVERLYVFPNMKEFKGALDVKHDLYDTDYFIGKVSLSEVLKQNEGKRFKIEILD